MQISFFLDFYLILLRIESNTRHTLHTDARPSMPPIAASLAEAKVAVENPERLFGKHGAVFLLMHSREKVDVCLQPSGPQRKVSSSSLPFLYPN